MAYVGAATAIAALGSSVYSSVEASNQARHAKHRDEAARAAAANAALAQRQKAQQDLNLAHARQPDPMDLLAAATLPKSPSTSLISGTSNANLSLLQLGRVKLLGE